MRRRYALLAALAVAGLVATWLVEPNLIVGLRSPRALAWTAGGAAVCLALGLAARRLGASPRVALAVGVVPGLVAAGLLVVRPILAPRSLDEALPSAAQESRVATGVLRGLAGHSARGVVSTYRLPDASHVVRFEGVDVGGTPDPHVYVLTGPDRTGKRGGVHLGALKAEKGSFNYVLPASFAPAGFTVVVWCERFAVDIAHATQA